MVATIQRRRKIRIFLLASHLYNSSIFCLLFSPSRLISSINHHPRHFTTHRAWLPTHTNNLTGMQGASISHGHAALLIGRPSCRLGLYFYFFRIDQDAQNTACHPAPQSGFVAKRFLGEKHAFCHARDLDRHHHHLTDSLPPRLGLSKTF